MIRVPCRDVESLPVQVLANGVVVEDVRNDGAEAVAREVVCEELYENIRVR